MLNIKKVGIMGLTVFASSAFLMNVNAAAHYELSDFKADNAAAIGSCNAIWDNSGSTPSIMEDEGLCDFQSSFPAMQGQKVFTFTITGVDLEDESSYDIYMDEEKIATKTGAELAAGAVINYDKTKTYGEKKLSIKTGSTVVKYDFEHNTGDTTTNYHFSDMIIKFNYSTEPLLPYSEIETIREDLNAKLDSMIKDGKIKINSIQPQTDEEFDFYVTGALNYKYGNDKYTFYAYVFEKQGFINITSKNYEYISVEREAEFEFFEKNSAVTSIVSTLSSKFLYTWEEINSDYTKRIVVEDLEGLNYLYNTSKLDDNEEILYNILNYSSKIHSLVDNKNIDFLLDVRAGGTDSNFYHMNVGQLNVIFDGVVYDNVGPVGFALTNIIYIPNDTAKTRDAYIAAAKKRISEYLIGADIDVIYGGKLADLEESQYSWDSFENNTVTYHHLFNVEESTGEWYIIKIGEKEYKYFIVADESKMNTPIVKSVDVNTNVYITTDSYEAPLDTNIRAIKLDKNSEKYKALAKKLKILDGLSFDLNMYSESLDMYIEKLDNGKFKVYIPIDESLRSKKLTAVFVKEDGSLENHAITIEGEYAVFETDHFSTYSIVDTKNPKTGDNLVLYILILAGSSYALYKVKKYN